ncbi:universal stress protein [Neorhodopirellula pilleata]|uniref:Universal stress protein n=1 Tax=Neorhodopirellula pilleata TaxID=2714738 RepID=A0A5C6ADT6_9BACT|nr:universal stress protein [Neorhodopirellula pilleata]TWT97468.1 Universal stress protein [Neorhodopirellula pilleata]
MKVLLAVDGSVHAAAATEFLSRFPLPRPISIEVMTVVNPPDVVVTAQSEMWYPQFIEHQEELAATTLERAKELLSRSSEKLNSSVNLSDGDASISTHRTLGHIGHTIVDRAAEGGFDLIVVAAKGHSAFERVLLGSVSDYVATHAQCSVLVVRPPIDPQTEASDENAQSDITGGELRTITVAVDQRDVSAIMVDHLCRYPFNQDQHFNVVTASVKLEVFREDILASTMEEAARRRTEAKQTAEAAADRLRHCDGAQCEHNVSSDSIEVEHVGEGLVQYAQLHDSDLVVLGDSQRGAISRFLLGSTSRYVLRHVNCSVLIVRQSK